MSIGARNRDMNDLWYAQALRSPSGATIPNAAVENILMMDDLQDEKTTRPGLWLESCKCHSMYNAALATRIDPRGFEAALKDRLRGVRGPDYLCIWMSTPQNRARLGIAAGDTVMPNERSELYPVSIDVCFSVANQYRPARSWDDLVGLLRNASAVVASLRIGHAIMFKGYDEVARELIYVDPDAPRQPGDWKNVRMTKLVHDRGIKPFVNVFPEER
jgi:hypothetical protein